MLNLEVSLNIFVLGLMVLGAGLIGYILRAKMLGKIRSRVEELERELLNNYAEILALEKENTAMESKLQDLQIPVISIKSAIKEETKESEKFPDVSLRKKLLSKENLLKQKAAGK